MKRYLCLLLLFPAITLLSPHPTFCQSAANTATPSGKLRFAVVVSDAHGAPIRDLHNDEFAIEILGKPHSAQIQGPHPGVDQNAVEGRGLVVVVIDAMHTLWAEEKDLRLNTGKYLTACAKRNLPVSLLLFSRNGVLIPVHDYTTNSATLAAALEQADAQMRHKTSKGGASPEVAAEAQRLLDFYTGQGNFASRQAIEEYPGAILGGIKSVTQYVAGVPGRKSLIWISSTLPFAVDEKEGKILSPTTQSLAPGDLIYPNLLTPDQVRQLQVFWEDSLGAAQSSELALYPVQTRATATVPLNPEVINSMSTLAHITGGVEVHSVGDFFGQFVDLTEENRAAYDLVVTPDAAWDCKSDWCPMKITVNRPGLHVLAPHGFFRDTSIVRDTPPSIVQTAGEPASGTNPIPFTVSWKPAEDAGGKKKIAFVVTFGPGAGIPAAGSTELNVEVMVHAFSGETDAQGVSFGANSKLTPSTLDQVRGKGFALNNAIELPPGEYSVRFVVHDKVSGRLGILKVPLKVGSAG